MADFTALKTSIQQYIKQNGNGEITGKQDGVATVNYNFDNIPDMLSEGSEYRIRTALINYETLYDNNNDSKFTAEEYTADFAKTNNVQKIYIRY